MDTMEGMDGTFLEAKVGFSQFDEEAKELFVAAFMQLTSRALPEVDECVLVTDEANEVWMDGFFDGETWCDAVTGKALGYVPEYWMEQLPTPRRVTAEDVEALEQ